MSKVYKDKKKSPEKEKKPQNQGRNPLVIKYWHWSNEGDGARTEYIVTGIYYFRIMGVFAFCMLKDLDALDKHFM